MELHIFTEPQQGATYDDLLRVAQATEDLGFDAFFRSDHYLGIMGDGRPGPTDAWVTLGRRWPARRAGSGSARWSARRRSGCPARSRSRWPQVDEMSGGRVELGLGAGWFAAEHRAYGIPFPDLRERFDRFAEQVEIIDGLWRTPVGRDVLLRRRALPAHRLAGAAQAGAVAAPADHPRRSRPEAPRGSLPASPTSSTSPGARLAETSEIFTGLNANLADTDRDPASSSTPPLRSVCVGTDDADVRRRAAVARARTRKRCARAGSPARRPRSSTRSASSPTSARPGSTCRCST